MKSPGVFLIQSINILQRADNYIKYKINFVSLNIYNCLSTIDYSCYGHWNTTILDILRDCIQHVRLKVDQASFDMVKSDVRLDYITNGNDNLFSIFRYLMNKMYYYRTKDDSLKFLLWDTFKEQYRMIDLKNRHTLGRHDQMVLSLMKSDKESMTTPERTQLATVT